MEPEPRIGLAALTQFVYQGGDLNALRAELASDCQNGTARAGAMMDLSVVEQLAGNLQLGLEWQSKALEITRVFRTFRAEPARKRLLVFAAPIQMGGNTPVEFLLPGDGFEILTYYPDFGRDPARAAPLPPHDIAFCAAPADYDGAEHFFDAIRAETAGTGVPVLNLPETLVKPERDTLPPRFEGVTGLRLPKTLRLERGAICDALDASCEDRLFGAVGGYPYVVRPVGSHAGLGLARIDSRDAFQSYLADRPETQFFVGEYIDYASPEDGKFRKYRIVLVDGKAFPCHMAIAEQWDVWYMNAYMQDSTEKRREEAAFMNRFEAAFGSRHWQAFAALSESLGMDYIGFDCAEDRDGNLVMFEADNALIVHGMDDRVTFPYKEKHMGRVFAAFEAMLDRRSRPAAKDTVPQVIPGHPVAVPGARLWA